MNVQPSSNLINLTFVIYGLHLFSAVVGLISSAFIVTAFLTGWPSLIAVILNYAKKAEVKGSFLESHFEWQIKTFWFSLIGFAIATLLFFTIVLIPVSIALFLALGVWVLYRLVRGFLRLSDRLPMPSGHEKVT
ncbi:MAG: putative membrane protein [Pseudohongiellaceae bacterium]|jgi:uncharacterized membrane protein